MANRVTAQQWNQTKKRTANAMANQFFADVNMGTQGISDLLNQQNSADKLKKLTMKKNEVNSLLRRAEDMRQQYAGNKSMLGSVDSATTLLKNISTSIDNVMPQTHKLGFGNSGSDDVSKVLNSENVGRIVAENQQNFNLDMYRRNKGLSFDEISQKQHDNAMSMNDENRAKLNQENQWLDAYKESMASDDDYRKTVEDANKKIASLKKEAEEDIYIPSERDSDVIKNSHKARKEQREKQISYYQDIVDKYSDYAKYGKSNIDSWKKEVEGMSYGEKKDYASNTDDKNKAEYLTDYANNTVETYEDYQQKYDEIEAKKNDLKQKNMVGTTYWEELLKEWEPYEDGYLLTKQEHNFKQLPEEEQQEMIDTFRKQYNTESPVKNFNPYNRQSVEDMQQYGKDIDLGYADRKKEELMEKYNYTPEEADSIIAYARRVINQENADREISEAGQYGQEHPVIGTLDSIPKNIGSGLGAVSNIWNILERGFSGSETPIDYNSPLNRISQNVNAQREGVKENIKSDLGKFIYDTAVSTADSAATLPINYFVPGATMVILGSSAAQQQMLENHQKGMSDNDAITGGIAAGIFEGLFEQLSLDKIVKTAGGTKSIKDFLKNTAVSMGIEGSEEAFTEIANITYDTLADGEYSDYNASVSAYKSQGYTENEAEKMARKDLAMRVAQSAAGGMLGGALMGAPIGGFNYAANSSYRKMAKYGSNITSGNSVSQLQAFIRKNYSKNQELYKQMENTDFTDDAYVGHLAVSAILSERQRAKQSYNDAVIPAVSRRLEELGVKPEDSEIVAYEVVYRTSDRSGNIVSETGKKYGDIITRVSDELSGTKDGKMQQWVKDIDFSWFEKHNQNAEMLDKLTQGESFAKKADKSTNEKIKEEISKKEQKGYVTGGRAHLLSDKDVTFDITALAVRDTDGKTVAAVKTDEGRTEFFDMDDVSAGKDIVELYLRGQKYSPEQRKTFFMTYDAGGALTSVESFATAFDEAYSQGTQSAGMESLMQDEEMQYSLTPEQIRMAYDAGKLEYEQNVVKKQQANLVKGRGLNHGTVSFDGVDEKKLNKTQKAATEIAKILTKAAGVNIKFFESRVDERGNYKGENGSYDWSTNTIRIDINAGMRSLNEGNNIMTVTLAHELTHYIERFSPEQYGRIQEFIFDKLSQKENENINTLINREIQRLKEEDGQRKAKEKTEEEYRKIAKSEIVARGCELMLTDKDAVKELAVRDRGIFGKLKSKIDKMVQSIEDACNELWDREGNYKPGTVSREARLLEEYAHQIRVLWNDALKEANQVTKIDSNSNEEIGKMIRYDVDNNPFVEISEDILDGIPEEQWNKKVKSVLKSRLKNGVKIGNNIIWQNAAGRKEFVYSKYAKKIYSSDKTLYMDKMRIANNIDEIITASRNYINYDLKHARKDGLKDFAWGTVNMRIGKTDYSADVIVGNSGTKLYLYDVINLKETKIKERRSSHQRYFQNGKVLEIATSSNNSISQNSENDNNILKQDRNTDVIKKAANKLGVSERFLESNLEGRSRESAVQYLRNNNQVKNSFISEKGLEVTPVLKEPTSSYGMSDNIKEFVRDNNISYKTLSENSRLREEYAKLIEHSKDGLGKKFLERRAQDKAQEFIDDMDGAMSGDTEAKEKISREIELAKGKAKAYDDGMSMERGWNELIKNYNKEFEEFISSNIAPMYNNAERNKKEFAQNVKDNVESYVEKAEKYFGTTNDYSLAAYIDINGKMLDFSDGGAIRGTDHRGIAEVLDTPSGVSGTEALTAFMNAGNIRIMDTGIDISVEPNEKQISVLRDYIASRNGEIYVDFSKEDGSPAGSARYSKGTSGGRILADINNYFEDGTIPENTYNAMSDFLYQDRRNTDSEGNELTLEQQEYFKDSKVRDDEGRLMVMYHGTPTGGFTVFKNDLQFFTPNKEYASFYEDPSASSRKSGKEKTNPQTYEVYLNMEHPFDIRDEETRELFINDYVKGGWALGINPYEEYKDTTKTGLPSWEEADNIYEWLEENEMLDDYDGIVVDEGGFLGEDNNVVDRGISYVIFNSNQVKLVTNDSPTDNSDIRYQDRTYSYDELVKKPDIKVPVLSAIKTSQYNNRADILNAAMNNLKNDTEVFINGEIAVIYNSDDDKYIEVSKRRLRHGIARRANEASIFVTLNIGDAIKYGIRVNEATGERNNADGAFVLLGKLTNTQGEDYYYRLIINTTNEGEYEVNRLYAAKAKKKVLGGNAPTPAGIKPAKLNTFFKLKVSDFLNEVKDYYVDSLSEDVNNHFGRVRGKSDIEGLLYQNRRISPKTYDEALIDNRGYQKALEHQKEIFNITKGHKPSDRGIERLTYKLIKETKTILSKDELKGAVRSVFDKAVKEKLNTEQVIKELKKVSYRALNEKRQNTKRTEYSQGILDELRNTRIKLTEEQAAGLLSTTGSRFGDWRKSMMGKVIITNNNTGTLLETKWEELSRTYPETFHKDTAPVEQPAELENIIFNLQNDYENDWGFDFEDAAEYCATEVLAEYSRLPEVKNSVAETDVLGELQNSYDTQLGKVRVEYYKRIKEFRKGQIKGIQEARKQWLEERKDRERQLKIRYENLMNQRIANIKNREDSAWMTRDKEKIRNNIIRKVKRLNTLVVRPTNQKHAPQGFLKKTAEFCQLFMDNTSVFSQSALDNLKLAYAALKPDSKDGNGNRVSYVLQDSYDVDIEDMIETLRNTIAGKRLAQLTLEELNTVNDIVNHFDTIVKNETEMEVNGRKQNIEAVSHDFMAELQEKGQYAEYDNPVSNTTGELLYNNLTPVYFFKRLGKTATRLFNDILEGQNKGGKNIYKARIFVLELKKRRHYDSWDFNKTVKLGDGIELNVEQAMYVYATAKREKQNIRQSAQHLSKGGIILKEKLVFEEDKDRKLRPKRKAAQQRSYHVRAFDLAEISNFLTAEQKAYADEMVGYLSKDMAELGNETSMQLYGFEKFDEDYYFPYKTADTYIEHSATGHKDVEPSLIAQSFTKKLQDKASNPVIIGDFTETAAEHINRMIVYNALAVAQNNLNKVFNYVEIFRDEETGEITGTGDSLKQMIEGTHGEKARKFFDSFIVSLNGGLKSDPVEGSAAKLLSMFKKARTYMSASVIIQQPSSVCRAMALIDPKYFNKILVTKKHWEECKKYNGVAVIKEMGGFDTGMGKGAVDYISDKKAETVMGKIQERVDNSLYAQLPGKMDEITWCTIWNAVKNETRDKGGFKGDEEAFFKAASERFNEVINKTQVYDSVIAKSANMNSKSGMMKMATAFMSEPTLSYNMLVDAGRKGAGKKYAARTVASLIMQIVTNGLLKALIQAARNSRDEDRDKSYWEKYVKAFSGNVFGEYFTGELNPLTWIPYARDVMSLLNGYDIERTDMAVLSDLTDALLNTAKMFDEDSDVSCFDVLKEWASSISAFTGIPVENLIRDGQAVWNLGNDFVNNNILPGNKTKLFNAFAEGMGFKTTDEDRIKDYLKSGDKKVLSELISEESDKAREEHLGYTDKMIEKEARSNVRKAITRVLKDYYFSGDLEKDDVIKKMKQTGLYLDDKGKDNSKDTLVDWEIAELKKQYLEVASGQENFEARKKIRKKLWETKHWKRLKDLDKQLKSWTQ